MFVAWLALGLSIANVAWNAWSWFRTGPRLLVIADVGNTSPLGIGDPAARIIVYNSGRTASTIYEVGFKSPNGAARVVTSDFDEASVHPQPLPERLEPHQRCKRPFVFRLSELHTFCEANDALIAGLLPYVKIGDRSNVDGTWDDEERAAQLGPHYESDD